MTTTPAVVGEGHLLLEHYEALRKDMVESDGRSHAVRGLALLMRKGMASWMKDVGEISAPARNPCTVPHEHALSPSIEQSLVDILATMAMATA